MRFSTLLNLFAAALVSAPLLAEPPNLLDGATFDRPFTIASWITIGSFRTSAVNEAATGWIGVDALASPDSGSLVVTGAGSTMRCVPISGGQPYDFGARMMIATRDGLGTPTAFLRVSFHADAQCIDTALAEAVTDNVAALPGRFVAVAKTAQLAPQGARSALVSVVLSTKDGLILLDGKRPAVYVDDAFLRESGGCVANGTTLCFANGKLRATVRYLDAEGPVDAPVIQTSRTNGYFYAASPDLPEITIKTYDFSETGGPKWIVVGGLTDRSVEITVEDLTHGDRRTYRNLSGFLEPIVDAFLNP